MTAAPKRSLASLLHRVPSELTTTAAFAIGIFAVVVAGAAISSAITAPSAVLFAAAYAVPAALAFGVYWILARRL